MSPRKIGRPKGKNTNPNRKPWDTPVTPDKSTWDRDSDILYASIGKALSRWEGLEEELAALFSSFLGGKIMNYAAIRAYGSIATARGRIEMLVSAAEIYFHDFEGAQSDKDYLLSRFDTLIEQISGFSARRNEIAHGIVGGTAQGYHLLRPARHNTGKVSKEGELAYTYTSKIIDGFASAFVDQQVLTNQLTHLVLAQNNGPELPPEPDAQGV